MEFFSHLLEFFLLQNILLYYRMTISHDSEKKEKQMVQYAHSYAF